MHSTRAGRLLFLAIASQVTTHAGMHQRQRIQILSHLKQLWWRCTHFSQLGVWHKVSMRCSNRRLNPTGITKAERIMLGLQGKTKQPIRNGTKLASSL